MTEEPIPHWPGQLVSLGDHEVFVRSVSAPGEPVQGEPAPVEPAPVEPAPVEPALCVHGLEGSSRNWTDLMDLLRPALACEALDLPGFGDSPPRPDGRYSIAALAQTVTALIEKQNRGPVHLMGNSLGGAVCVKVAATRPELIRTLTLISPALPDGRPRMDLLRFPVIGFPWLGTWLFQKLQLIPPERRVADVIATCYSDPRLLARARFAAEVAELTRRDSLSYAGAALAGSARALTAEVLRAGGSRPGGTRPVSPRRHWSSTAATTAWSIRGTRAGPRTRLRTPRSWCCRAPATSRRWSVLAWWRPRSVCS